MSRVEAIEKQVEKLSAEELEHFRLWFARFDAEVWDGKIEADAKAGRLDSLADKALSQDKAAKSREL